MIALAFALLAQTAPISASLAHMRELAPSTPWQDTYANTSRAIELAASEHALFEGPDGARRTAALLVAVAYRESAFRQDAIGDHGSSRGPFQIQTDHDWRDIRATTLEAMRILRLSLTTCEGPIEERLSLYATGTCDSAAGRRISRDRFSLARRLLQ